MLDRKLQSIVYSEMECRFVLTSVSFHYALHDREQKTNKWLMFDKKKISPQDAAKNRTVKA